MKELLFLAHRIPFPPNKGDKIRSYNLLKHLVRDYRVHLGTFIDDPDDWKHVDELRALCGETLFVGIDPRRRKLRSLTALATGGPLTLAYYRHRAMGVWVDRILSRPDVERVLVFSSAMAQYVSGELERRVRRVIDFVDVDSEKWRAYSTTKPWPLCGLYQREGRTLLDYERAVAGQFDASIFVSAQEAALFEELAPEVAGRVSSISNGVDSEFFRPQGDYRNPYPAAARVLVFTGAMDYWANVDAVRWFAHEIFPEIREAIPEARFFIVGARPAEAVRQLARLPGIQVTGAVHDIRPYLAHACVAVAPLRIARGIQNKVLEAMAMGRPVLATRAALDGIQPCPGMEALIADQTKLLAEKAIDLLRHGDRAGLGERGREHVERHYDWMENLRRIEKLLEFNRVDSAERSQSREEKAIDLGHTPC